MKEVLVEVSIDGDIVTQYLTITDKGNRLCLCNLDTNSELLFNSMCNIEDYLNKHTKFYLMRG